VGQFVGDVSAEAEASQSVDPAAEITVTALKITLLLVQLEELFIGQGGFIHHFGNIFDRSV
jgi:hypothetical protein